jgi:hypothetical protein
MSSSPSLEAFLSGQRKPLVKGKPTKKRRFSLSPCRRRSPPSFVACASPLAGDARRLARRYNSLNILKLFWAIWQGSFFCRLAS